MNVRWKWILKVFGIIGLVLFGIVLLWMLSYTDGPRLALFLCLLLVFPFLPLFALFFPKHRRWAIALNWVFTALALGWVILICWFFVELLGYSGPHLSDLVIAPFPLILAICAIVAARAYRSRVNVVLVTVFFVTLLVMVFTDYTPMKPFARLRDSIHDGMTQAGIFAALRREFPPNGRFASPAVYFTVVKIDGGGGPSEAERENTIEKGPYAAPLDSFKEGEIHISLHPELSSHGEDNVGGSWAFYMRDGRVVYLGR